MQVTSEWLTEEAKQTRETLRAEAARVAGDRATGKAFDNPKRVALVSCMAAIFIKSTNKSVFFQFVYSRFVCNEDFQFNLDAFFFSLLQRVFKRSVLYYVAAYGSNIRSWQPKYVTRAENCDTCFAVTSFASSTNR